MACTYHLIMVTLRVFDTVGSHHWVRTRVSFVDASPLTFLTGCRRHARTTPRCLELRGMRTRVALSWWIQVRHSPAPFRAHMLTVC
jgi:hypothetical protein